MYKFMLPANYRIMLMCGNETHVRQQIARTNEIIKTYDLENPTRKQEVCLKRQLVMWYLRKNTTLSLEKIGQMLGGKNHATVLHGEKAVENDLNNKDKYFMKIVESINTELREIFTVKAF